MDPGLEKPLPARSALEEDILAYLEALSRAAAELPEYYPAHLRTTQEPGETPFDQVRQVVCVVDAPGHFEEWLAEEQERERGAGNEFNRWDYAYAPRYLRPGLEEKDTSWRPALPGPLRWDEHAGQRFRRAVILGVPGSGKTWLLRYEARRLAVSAAARLRRGDVTVQDLVFPIMAQLSDLCRDDGPLEEALEEYVAGKAPGAFRSFVRDKLKTERCVVLLDAWDEATGEGPGAGQPGEFLASYPQRLGRRLADFARKFSLARILLTSRTAGYGARPIPGAQEVELAPLETPRVESFVRAWFRDDGKTADLFLDGLRRSHQVRGLARVPLMLALMCRAYREGTPAFPARRVEVYDRCLRGLLRDWKEEAQRRLVSDLSVTGILSRLATVALKLQRQQRDRFTEAELAEAPGLDMKESSGQTTTEAEEFVASLKRDGIVVAGGADGRSSLCFLHRSFQEYLAASALAVRANHEGWDRVAGLVSRKAWLPRWQEVIVLLAGLLDDPGPLLQMLSRQEPSCQEPRGDCYFRTRLALAARCLPELKPEIRQRRLDAADRITAKAFSLWYENELKDTAASVSHLTLALPALGWSNASVEGVPFLDRLVRMLQDPDGDVRAAAARAIRGIGVAAATPGVLGALIRLLQDRDDLVRLDGKEAIRGIGAAGATVEVLVTLPRLLQDREWRVRRDAAEAIGAMGAAAATPEVLDGLYRMLQDREGGVRSAAVDAIGRMWPAAAPPDFLLRLPVWLKDREYLVRSAAVRAVGCIGSPAATPEVLGGLVRMLRGPELCFDAAWAIGRIGSAAATPKVLGRLAGLLKHKEEFLRSAAARAIGGIGPAAVPPDFLELLPRMLRDRQWRVRHGAANVIGAIGAATVPQDIFGLLAGLLKDEERLVRSAAARVIAGIGPAAATADFLDLLAPMLQDPECRVRHAAVEAIGGVGAAAATPEVLSRLARMLWDLEDPGREGWFDAAQAIGYMGAAAATPEILSLLARMIQDGDGDVGLAGAEAVADIGPGAATREILDGLIEMLHFSDVQRYAAADAAGRVLAAVATPDQLDRMFRTLQGEDRDARTAAAEALQGSMALGFRFFHRNAGGWEAVSVDELAGAPMDPTRS
ncbi:MAG: HEAT repeat domain-containing protein [Chloroflexi bacterium]|nr:HEAT repeat domain-containing protein [Chloroflexota bacterium]